MVFYSWKQLEKTENLKDFGELIITIQSCVIKKFLQGFMAPKQKKKKKQGGEENSKAEEVDEEKKLAEEARVRGQNEMMEINGYNCALSPKRYVTYTLGMHRYGNSRPIPILGIFWY